MQWEIAIPCWTVTLTCWGYILGKHARRRKARQQYQQQLWLLSNQQTSSALYSSSPTLQPLDFGAVGLSQAAPSGYSAGGVNDVRAGKNTAINNVVDLLYRAAVNKHLAFPDPNWDQFPPSVKTSVIIGVNDGLPSAEAAQDWYRAALELTL